MTTGKIFKSLIKTKRDNSDNHWRGSASTVKLISIETNTYKHVNPQVSDSIYNPGIKA